MRTVFVGVIVACSLLMLLGVVVFHVALEISWIDAIYFVISTVTTVGYGDYSLKDAAPAVKLFGCFLMLSGAAMLAAGFGLLTDYLLKVNLAEIFSPWRRRMKNHVVVCGLSNVGLRIVEHLVRLGHATIVIADDDENRFVEDVHRLKVPVVFGDIRQRSVLEKANIADALAVVAAEDDDLVNLEVGLNARESNPDIRVVLRMFDQGLADKVRGGFAINTAMSTSALAAPAFAMAAVDPQVVGSFSIDGKLMLIVEIEVAAGSRLEGGNTGEVYREENLSILCHQCAASGEKSWHPARSIALNVGDRLTVTAAHEVYGRIKELNA
ncbi:MAG: NAD-binding protein [Pirellulaceae bacterium]